MYPNPLQRCVWVAEDKILRPRPCTRLEKESEETPTTMWAYNFWICLAFYLGSGCRCIEMMLIDGHDMTHHSDRTMRSPQNMLARHCAVCASQPLGLYLKLTCLNIQVKKSQWRHYTYILGYSRLCIFFTRIKSLIPTPFDLQCHTSGIISTQEDHCTEGQFGKLWRCNCCGRQGFFST